MGFANIQRFVLTDQQTLKQSRHIKGGFMSYFKKLSTFLITVVLLFSTGCGETEQKTQTEISLCSNHILSHRRVINSI